LKCQIRGARIPKAPFLFLKLFGIFLKCFH
jgi:hypothetical protein